MRMDEAFYNLLMYLLNKKVLEYAQIAQSRPKSIIRDTEGLSNNYSNILLLCFHQNMMCKCIELCNI